MNHNIDSPRLASTSIPLVVQVGFAGSRRLYDPVRHPHVDAHAFATEVEKRLDEELASLPTVLRLDPGYFLCGLSQIAIGADLLFARTCARQQIPHRLFLPQTRDAYLSAVDDEGRPDFSHVQQEIARAHINNPNTIQERVVSDAATRTERFTDTNMEIVRVSDVVVGLFRKDAAAPLGGTRDMMKRAKARGRPVLEIRVDVGPDDRPTFETEWYNGKAFCPPSIPSELRMKAHELDTRPDIVFQNISDDTRALAGRSRWFFQVAALLIVGAHVLATMCAAYVSAFHPAGMLFFFIAEALLLAAGCGFHHHLQISRTARVWSMARLVEQIAVSLRALGGVNAYPAYLFALPIPESLRALRRTLCVMHLKATRRSEEVSWSTRRDRYVQDRLIGPAGQLGYYKERCDAARRNLHRAHCIFYTATIAAVLATLAKAALTAKCFAISEAQHHATLPWLSFAAILLPVLAVAAMSLAACFDLEAKAHTFSELVVFLDRRLHLLAQASTEREFHSLALDVEAHLLGETTTWYARRAYTGVT